MCGIVGIVSLDFDTPVGESRLRRMRDVLSHRGPDGQGLWCHGPVGLGHRRLAVVDIDGGHQPMANEDRSAWITFNGEIYNHGDLRPELEERGHIYRSRCDTETILHLYEEEGERAVERLRGMFAFAIWDRSRRRLLLARDRLGIKPLYYAITDRELLFGSEIKAILASDGIRPAFNGRILSEFLATRYVAGEETFFKGVYKLRPGHTLTWSPDDGVTGRRYWSLPASRSDRPTSLAAEAATLRENLSSAISRHLMSDVPVGLFLSGGLDSSALAVLASRLVKGPLQTFAVGFADPGANELPYARLVAQHVGARHREVLLSPNQYFDALPHMVWQEDEPIAFTSSVPLYFVSSLASRHVKVVLTGEGADELFLGYNRYRVTLWNGRLGWPYWAVTPRAVRGGIRNLIDRLPRPIRRYAGRTCLALDPGPRALFFDNFAVFPDRLRAGLMMPSDEDTRDPYAVGLDYYRSAPGGELDRMSHADMQTYLHELLMKQDQMSMAASIESRVPFLDDTIVEQVAAMPASLKLRGSQTKAVLRAAVRDLLPPQVLSRRKMGFPVPVGRWLRQRFSPVVDEFVLGPRARARGLFQDSALTRLAEDHRTGQADHGDRLWLLVNLEMWHRVFCDGEAPSEIMRPLRRRTAVSYAGVVAQDGRPVAPEYRRPAAQLPNPVGVVAAASRGGGHD